jgi:predicted HTH domain antitoxin
MTRWEFEDLLGKRAILRHYTAEELREDIQYGLGGQ